MGLFGVCDDCHPFCVVYTEECLKKISALEVFEFLKCMGVTPENVGSYVDAFKKWLELSVQRTPLNVVYLAEKNHLVSLPLFDPCLARFVVGMEIKGTCFFEHDQKKREAPRMSHEQAHAFLLKRTAELLKLSKGNTPRVLTFPTTVDLKNWSEEDPHVAQTLSIINLDRNYVSRHILSYMRCENGMYWIEPTLRQSLAKVCARLDYDKLGQNQVKTREPQSQETLCRAMAVAHLDSKYDFRGGFTEFGELTPETAKELAHLRRLCVE